MTKTAVMSCLLITAMTSSIAAQTTSLKNLVEQRKATMRQMDLAIRTAKSYSSKKTFDPDMVRQIMGIISVDGDELHAQYLASNAADPKSVASQEIRKNWPDFSDRLRKLSNLATSAGNATTVEAFMPAFVELTASCTSCHVVYRKP